MNLYTLFLISGLTIFANGSGCGKKEISKSPVNTCYEGKLAVKGICMNYTIQLLDGEMDTSLIVGNWTDPTTNTAYSNVFALGSPCNFPATLKQGDRFYFQIDTIPTRDCAVCMAYYPTPGKSLAIKVIPACK